MSGLSIAPDAVLGAGGNLANLGTALRSATAAAASPTTAIAAPAADEVSAAVTSVFGANAQKFQTLSAGAAAFHDQFVNLLNSGAAQYANAELTNAQQTLANAVNAPVQAVLGNPSSLAAGVVALTGPTNQSFSLPFGPFTISGNQTVTPTADGFSGVINAGITINGLRGPVTLFSASGTENFSATTGIASANITGSGPFIWAGGGGTLNDTTGAFAAGLAWHGPFYSAAGSVNGTVPVGGTGSPQITGLSLEVDGLPLPVQVFTGVVNGLFQRTFASL